MHSLEKIFSVKNSDDKRYKVITVLAVKFKFKRNYCPPDNVTNDINIAFIVSGGFGDFLINANYIYNFAKYIEKEKNKNIIIDVYSNPLRQDSFKAVFKEGHYGINHLGTSDNRRKVPYDVTIGMCAHINGYNFKNLEKIKNISPKLYEIYLDFEKFKNEFKNNNWFFYTNIYQLMLARNLKYIQLPDISRRVGIKEEFDFPLCYPDNENEILKKFNLENKTFVTFNRAVDKNALNPESTKMWQYEKFCKLAELIKAKYPNIILVQLGAKKDGLKIENMDINLSGMTDFEDIKVLIKNSTLHIDCEGGFAHLRNALKAPNPAIVIFGPTNPELYGYKSNINIYKKACPICCDWVWDKWQNKCLRGEKIPSCTNSITAEDVFLKADEYLESVVK